MRHGRLLGGKAYFPNVPPKHKATEVLSAFIGQFYLQTEIAHSIPERDYFAVKNC